MSKVRKPSWNTSDRKRPQNSGSTDIPPIIYTPYEVKVDKEYKGDTGAKLDVKWFGGQIGEDRFEFEGAGQLPEVGQRVILLVSYIGSEKNGDVLAVPLSVYFVDGTRARAQFGGRGDEELDVAHVRTQLNR